MMDGSVNSESSGNIKNQIRSDPESDPGAHGATFEQRLFLAYYPEKIALMPLKKEQTSHYDG